MPSKLPQREQEIAARLSEFRRERLMTRAALAKELGVERDRLTSYELARVPLRADVALKLWKIFGLSPAWLAAGDGDESLPCELFFDLAPECDPRETLSSFYSRSLESMLQSDESKRKQAFHTLMAFLNFVNAGIKADIFSEEERALILEFGDGMMKIMQAKQGKEPLVSSTKALFNEAVPPHTPYLPRLIARVRKLLTERGAQRKLADEFGVKPQLLSRWLTETAEPGGEMTLRLQAWADDAMKQKQDGGRVALRPPRKAQTKLNTTNAKKGSGPPK